MILVPVIIGGNSVVAAGAIKFPRVSKKDVSLRH
jgi:hypothetical protein